MKIAKKEKKEYTTDSTSIETGNMNDAGSHLLLTVKRYSDILL